jgi:hypothetical protein
MMELEWVSRGRGPVMTAVGTDGIGGVDLSANEFELVKFSV